MKQRIVHHVRRLLIGIILAWGALALIVRLATPLLEWAHHPVEAWLSEQAGQPVRFARMETSWWGIGPRLQLQDLTLGEGAEALRLHRVEVDLSHLNLLRGRVLEALRLTLDGLALRLVRETDGGLHIEGFPAREQGGATIPLPRHLRLRNVRLEWEDRLHGRPPVVVNPIDLDLLRRGNRLRLRGHLDSPMGKARFGADIRGFLTTERWSGTSYLKLDGLQLAGLLGGYLPPPYHVAKGRLNLELWQEWAEAREKASSGAFTLEDFRLKTGTTEPPLELAMLRGEVDYRRENDRRWQIRLSQAQLQTDRKAAPLSLEAVVRRSQDEGQLRLDLGVTRLPLDLLQRLARQRWPGVAAVPSPIIDGITGLNPHGELRNLQMRWSPDAHQDAWALSAHLHQTNITPWQAIPGITGLSGRLVAHPGQVDLQLTGNHLLLDHRQLFRQPHRLEHLQGKLHWLADDDGGWKLIVPRLRLETPDTTARLWLQLTNTAQRPLHLDLRAHLDEGPVSAVPRYLPTAIMGEDLVHWLDHSLGPGRLLGADLLISGPLADFPFDRKRNGNFEVVARASGVRVEYQKGWPPLEEAEARLSFQQNSMQIDLLGGRLYHSRVRQARVRLRSLNPVSPLQVSGLLEGPLEDELRLLQSPALADRLGTLARQLQASGPIRLDLELRIPLAARHPDYRLDARLHLLENRLRLTNWQLDLEKLRGTLQVTLDAVRAKGIAGIALGRPVTLDVTESPNKGARIVAHTRWDIPLLQKQFPTLPLQIAEGESEVTVWLDIPHHEGPTTLTVRSPLNGIRVDLPPPLGKMPEQQRLLVVSLPLADPPGPVHLRYGRQLDARFTLDGTRSELRYARGAAQLPGHPLHRVRARLPAIDLEAWHTVAAQLGLLRGVSSDSPPWEADLEAGALHLGEITLTRTKLHAEQGEKGQLEIRLEGPEAKGTVRYRPAGRGFLIADFERLYLPFDANEDTDDAPPDPSQGPDPRELPQVDFACKDLRLAKARLGAARLVMRPEDRGARIAALVFEGPSGLLKAQGNWLWEKTGAHTWLNGLFDGGDLGALLAGLGYPRVMDKGRARIRFDLDWPGHPLQLHRATVQGTSELDLRDGRLSELEPGISRVLGLLSLDALKRRLKLDFGDLLKKGYSFDSITGSLSLGQGQARTRDLVVDGPSGRIEFGGKIDLVHRAFDSVVQVTPKLDATLVVASTIAGGPVAGAATFLAQRLLSEEVDRINRFEYSVTGSWDAPKITPLDSGGPLSRIVNTLGGRKSETKTQAQEEAIDESKTQPGKGLLERIFGTHQAPPREEALPEGSLPGQD